MYLNFKPCIIKLLAVLCIKLINIFIPIER